MFGTTRLTTTPETVSARLHKNRLESVRRRSDDVSLRPRNANWTQHTQFTHRRGLKHNRCLTYPCTPTTASTKHGLGHANAGWTHKAGGARAPKRNQTTCKRVERSHPKKRKKKHERERYKTSIAPVEAREARGGRGGGRNTCHSLLNT